MGDLAKKRIVVLGGGVGAMTAVFHLTSVPNWQEKYDITVYQLGWRLGGKGASGRGEHNRIEEHGLHMWYGFYENAFKAIQACYKEMGRKPGEPLATWEEAFKPQNFTVYQEKIDGKWKHWPMTLPTNDSTPGEGGEFPTEADMVSMILQEMVNTLVQAQQPEGPLPPDDDLPPGVKSFPWWRRLIDGIEDKLEDTAYKGGILLLSVALKITQDLERFAAILPGDGSSTVHHLLEQFHSWLHNLLKEQLDNDDNLRRLWIMLDLSGTIVRGLLADKVHKNGLASINNLDFMEWLKKHGVDPDYTLPFVLHNFYDQAFAFEDGRNDKPNFSAGVVVYTAMRTYFTYKGAILWKMQAGMGDTIFGPFYQVLKKRGVTFHYFHKVENLHVSGDSINQISMQVQATVTTPGGYQPFRDVKGLPSWPSQPDYSQLKEGKEIQKNGYNLESFWTPWPGVGQKVLEAGRDYDMVLLGISLGAIPYICRELVEARTEWQNMVQNVKTIQTQAFQLWLRPDDAGLGWPMWRKQPATLTGYDADDDLERAGLDTWGDFSHLIIRESWPDAQFPNNIAYFCGAMLSADGLKLPPPTDRGFPQQAAQDVERNSRYFLDHYLGHLWPLATQSDNPNELNWDLVVSQYYRANIDPSERYVLCVKDSVQYRLKPGDSKFANLYLAGDWTDNGLLSLGCVESAVLGGMQAANAILPQFGYPPVEIIGWAE